MSHPSCRNGKSPKNCFIKTSSQTCFNSQSNGDRRGGDGQTDRQNGRQREQNPMSVSFNRAPQRATLYVMHTDTQQEKPRRSSVVDARACVHFCLWSMCVTLFILFEPVPPCKTCFSA